MGKKGLLVVSLFVMLFLSLGVVSAEECTFWDKGDCSGLTPACKDNVCVQCKYNFHCNDLLGDWICDKDKLQCSPDSNSDLEATCSVLLVRILDYYVKTEGTFNIDSKVFFGGQLDSACGWDKISGDSGIHFKFFTKSEVAYYEKDCSLEVKSSSGGYGSAVAGQSEKDSSYGFELSNFPEDFSEKDVKYVKVDAWAEEDGVKVGELTETLFGSDTCPYDEPPACADYPSLCEDCKDCEEEDYIWCVNTDEGTEECIRNEEDCDDELGGIAGSCSGGSSETCEENPAQIHCPRCANTPSLCEDCKDCEEEDYIWCVNTDEGTEECIRNEEDCDDELGGIAGSCGGTNDEPLTCANDRSKCNSCETCINAKPLANKWCPTSYGSLEGVCANRLSLVSCSLKNEGVVKGESCSYSVNLNPDPELGAEWCYDDDDNDGHGAFGTGDWYWDCDNYLSENDGDCDDDEESVNEDETENCDDGLDNNCNGNVDCDDSYCSTSSSCVEPLSCEITKAELWDTGSYMRFSFEFSEECIGKEFTYERYLDGSFYSGGGSYVVTENKLSFDSNQPSGLSGGLWKIKVYSTSDSSVPEVWSNELDLTSLGEVVGCYKDQDKDGFGSSNDYREFLGKCGKDPEGDSYVSEKGDCHDANPKINPEEIEVCNDDIDNNCNDAVDESGCVISTPGTCYHDSDGDGYGGGLYSYEAEGSCKDMVSSSGGDHGFVDTPGDCDDSIYDPSNLCEGSGGEDPTNPCYEKDDLEPCVKDGSSGFCIDEGDVCEIEVICEDSDYAGDYYFKGDCMDGADDPDYAGDFCDAVLDDGSFDKDYGAFKEGVCVSGEVPGDLTCIETDGGVLINGNLDPNSCVNENIQKELSCVNGEKQENEVPCASDEKCEFGSCLDDCSLWIFNNCDKEFECKLVDGPLKKGVCVQNPLPTCGDDILDYDVNGERCDKKTNKYHPSIGEQTCESLGLGTGEALTKCNDVCTGWDTSGCSWPPSNPNGPPCGNDVKEEGEQCDGIDLNGETCESWFELSGTLSCDFDCTFDKGDCIDSIGDCTEDSVEPCSKGQGICLALGEITTPCEGDTFGDPSECDAAEITPKVEDCTNDLDDDCNGEVNEIEDCPPPAGDCTEDSVEPCSKGQGICLALGEITTPCEGDTFGDPSECDAAEITPKVEDCTNDLDDDCNGEVNEIEDCPPPSNPNGPSCGNEVKEEGEQCDGIDLNGETCESWFELTGTLSCESDCTFDKGGCSVPEDVECRWNWQCPEDDWYGLPYCYGNERVRMKYKENYCDSETKTCEYTILFDQPYDSCNYPEYYCATYSNGHAYCKSGTRPDDEACYGDSSCPGDSFCVGQRCLCYCDSANDCNVGESCVDCRCVEEPESEESLQEEILSEEPECTIDSDCGEEYGRTYCNPDRDDLVMRDHNYCDESTGQCVSDSEKYDDCDRLSNGYCGSRGWCVEG